MMINTIPGYGYVCRNKDGQIGIVLGYRYDYQNDYRPYKFWGVGLCNGRWKSYDIPEIITKNIKEFIKLSNNK